MCLQLLRFLVCKNGFSVKENVYSSSPERFVKGRLNVCLTVYDVFGDRGLIDGGGRRNQGNRGLIDGGGCGLIDIGGYIAICKNEYTCYIGGYIAI